jgi:hypothetical protein
MLLAHDGWAQAFFSSLPTARSTFLSLPQDTSIVLNRSLDVSWLLLWRLLFHVALHHVILPALTFCAAILRKFCNNLPLKDIELLLYVLFARPLRC